MVVPGPCTILKLLKTYLLLNIDPKDLGPSYGTQDEPQSEGVTRRKGNSRVDEVY